MDGELKKLSDIDHKIGLAIKNDKITGQEILELVDTRDQILKPLIDYASKNEQFAKSQEWQNAIIMTQQLIQLMTAETSRIGGELRKLRMGKKSIQQYQKFL